MLWKIDLIFYSKILWFKEFKVFYIFKEKLLEDVSKVNNKTCKNVMLGCYITSL